MTSISLKSSKGNLFYILLAYFGLMIVPVRLLLEKSYAIGMVLALCFTAFAIRWYIAVFRTILIDESGITVCFLRWKRSLPWGRIVVRRETYHSLGHASSSAAIVFAEKGRFIQKPRKMQPFLFNLLVRPFSFLYAYMEESANFSGPGIYSVKEREICELLETLGQN